VVEIQSGSIGLRALISSKLVGPLAVRRLTPVGSGRNLGIYSPLGAAPWVALRIVFSISLGCGGRVIHSVTRSMISSSSISFLIRALTADMSQRWQPSPASGHSAIPNSLGLLSVIIVRILLLEYQVVVFPILPVIDPLAELVSFSVSYSYYVLCHKLLVLNCLRVNLARSKYRHRSCCAGNSTPRRELWRSAILPELWNAR
jgi:hypothetical protein